MKNQTKTHDDWDATCIIFMLLKVISSVTKITH